MENNIIDIINNRASCRSYLEKEIPEDILNQLLDAACRAPSGGGFQAYSIIKVTDKEKKDKLVDLCRGQKFISKAPVNLIFCIDYRRIKRINEVEPCPFDLTDKFMDFWMTIIDTAVAAHTLCLAAESYGLKSVYIGNILHTVDQVSELLNIPDYVCPSIMLTLGYPKTVPKQPTKYSRDIIVHEEEYKDTDIDKLVEAYNIKNNNWKMKLQEKFINRVYETALELHGKEYAEKCKEDILNKGYISSYQYWFGCYYLDGEDFMQLDDYVKFMRKKGFNWI